MDDVIAYMDELGENQRKISKMLHELIVRNPRISSKIRYKIPFYFQKSWICYLNPLKKDQVEIAFTRANELSNEQGLLDFKGRKQIAGITIADTKDIEINLLSEILEEAYLLDMEVPYQSKRSKK